MASTGPETLESAVLVIEKPDASSLIPYTERAFPKTVEAGNSLVDEP